LGSGQSAAPGEPVRGPETPLGRSDHVGIPLACGVGRCAGQPVAPGRAVSAGRLGLAGQRAGHGSPGLNVTASGAAGWCGPWPVARRRAPRSRRWRGSAAAPTCRRSAISPPIPLRPRVRVACQCPPLSRIQITGQEYSSSGPWLTWHIGPLACMCRTVSPRQVCRPRIASLIPSSSGNATAAAAQPSPAGPALVFLRWGVRQHAQPRSGQVAGGRGGDAVAADADPPRGQPLEGASIQRCGMCARRDRPGAFAYYSLHVRVVSRKNHARRIDARFLKIIRSAAAAAADACPSFAHTVTWVTPERKSPFVLAILDPKITGNGKMPGERAASGRRRWPARGNLRVPKIPAHPGMFQPPRISDVLRAVSMTWSPPAGTAWGLHGQSWAACPGWPGTGYEGVGHGIHVPVSKAAGHKT